jgi:predicted transcriptional regulator
MKYATDKDLRGEIRKMLARDSQEAVATRLGMSQPALSQFLNGSRPHASDGMLKRMGYLSKRFYQKVGKEV